MLPAIIKAIFPGDFGLTGVSRLRMRPSLDLFFILHRTGLDIFPRRLSIVEILGL